MTLTTTNIKEKNIIYSNEIIEDYSILKKKLLNEFTHAMNSNEAVLKNLLSDDNKLSQLKEMISFPHMQKELLQNGKWKIVKWLIEEEKLGKRDKYYPRQLLIDTINLTTDDKMETLTWIVKLSDIQEQLKSHLIYQEMMSKVDQEQLMLIIESSKKNLSSIGQFARNILEILSKEKTQQFNNEEKIINLIDVLFNRYHTIFKTKMKKEFYANIIQKEKIEIAQYLLDKNHITPEFIYENLYENSYRNEITEKTLEFYHSNNISVLDRNYQILMEVLLNKDNNKESKVAIRGYLRKNYPEQIMLYMRYLKSVREDKRSSLRTIIGDKDMQKTKYDEEINVLETMQLELNLNQDLAIQPKKNRIKI